MTFSTLSHASHDYSTIIVFLGRQRCVEKEELTSGFPGKAAFTLECPTCLRQDPPSFKKFAKAAVIAPKSKAEVSQLRKTRTSFHQLFERATCCIASAYYVCIELGFTCPEPLQSNMIMYMGL